MAYRMENIELDNDEKEYIGRKLAAMKAELQERVMIKWFIGATLDDLIEVIGEE